MTPDQAIMVKKAQIEACYIIYNAQTVAKWVIKETECAIMWAQYGIKPTVKK